MKGKIHQKKLGVIARFSMLRRLALLMSVAAVSGFGLDTLLSRSAAAAAACILCASTPASFAASVPPPPPQATQAPAQVGGAVHAVVASGEELEKLKAEADRLSVPKVPESSDLAKMLRGEGPVTGVQAPLAHGS
jgi:hypothetical protein